MTVVQVVGWAVAAVGIAISIYIGLTGNWVVRPRPFGTTNFPATVRGRRLS